MSKRPHYREEQVLYQQDLADEQGTLLAQQYRHQTRQHHWGIVRGLQLYLAGGDSRVFLSPGLAVDGYGRPLAVSNSIEFDARWFVELLGGKAVVGSETGYRVDVWLNYRAVEQLPDARQASWSSTRATGRTCESAWIRLTCAGDDVRFDPRHPPGVGTSEPQEDNDSETERDWPVYLGRIELHIDRERGLIFSLPRVPLAWAELTGAGIDAPWKGSWLQIGSSNLSERHRFSVLLPDDTGNQVRRLSLDQQGNLLARGRIRFRANPASYPRMPGQLALHPRAGQRHHEPALAFTALDAKPEAARSWQVYLTGKGHGADDVPRWCFELHNPGEDGVPALNQWAAGVRQDSAPGRFEPVLTARADGVVTINGTLEVEGRLVEGPVPLDFNDARFRDELLSRWTRGLTTAGREVDAFYAVSLAIDIDIRKDGSSVDHDNLLVGEAYTIDLQVRNVSRDMVARLMRIEFTVEYFATGQKRQTLFPLPSDPEIVAGDSRPVSGNTFVFDTEGRAQAMVKITTTGLARNSTEVLERLDLNIT